MAGVIRKDMETQWFISPNDFYESQWADDINATLDDALSKSSTTAQAIASPISLLSGAVHGANIDLDTYSLLVNDGASKTITATNLAKLEGLDQFHNQNSDVEYAGLTISGLANGIIRASGGQFYGGATTDFLPQGVTNLYWTPSKVTGLIKPNTGITWDYVGTPAGSETLTPTLVNIQLNQLTSEVSVPIAGKIIVGAVTTGIPTYVAMSGDVTIAENGIITIANNSHLHSGSYYTETLTNGFFEGFSAGSKYKVDYARLTNIQSEFAPEIHDMITTHNDTGLNAGEVIRSTAVDTFSFSVAQHGELGGITSDQHHAQAHNLQSHAGNLLFTQVDDLAPSTGAGASAQISRASHRHTNNDGSTKISYESLNNTPNEFSPVSTHLTHDYSVRYSPLYLYTGRYTGTAVVILDTTDAPSVIVVNSDSTADGVWFFIVGHKTGYKLKEVIATICPIDTQQITMQIIYGWIKTGGVWDANGAWEGIAGNFLSEPSCNTRLNITPNLTLDDTDGRTWIMRMYGELNSSWRIYEIEYVFENVNTQ